MKEIDQLPDPHVRIPNSDLPEAGDLRLRLANMRTIIAEEREKMGEKAFDESLEDFRAHVFNRTVRSDTELLRMLVSSEEAGVRNEPRWYQIMLNEMTARGMLDPIDALATIPRPAMKPPPGPQILEKMESDVDIEPFSEANDNRIKEVDLESRWVELLLQVKQGMKKAGTYTQERIREIQQVEFDRLSDEAVLREVLKGINEKKLEKEPLSYQALVNEVRERKLLE